MHSYIYLVLLHDFLPFHQIETESSESNEEEREGRLFPDEGDKNKITSFALTADFLVYGNEVINDFQAAAT